jgi:hypothetical protein
VTICDGGHFAASVSSVWYNYGLGNAHPFQEAEMAKAMKKTGTRFARWYNAFRESRYYSRFE